jgi:hypothetical protein
VSLHLALFSVYQQQQRYSDAVDEFLKVEALANAPAERSAELKAVFDTKGWEAFLRKLLQTLDGLATESGHAKPWPYIGIYAQLRDKEKTFYWLEKAADSRDVALLQLKIEPSFDFLRDDPRYIVRMNPSSCSFVFLDDESANKRRPHRFSGLLVSCASCVLCDSWFPFGIITRTVRTNGKTEPRTHEIA